VIVATIAFGMGIDKPDVRFRWRILDFQKTVSRAYYQAEPARAGRDGKPSSAWMAFIACRDIVQQRRMIDESTGGGSFQKRVRSRKLTAGRPDRPTTTNCRAHPAAQDISAKTLAAIKCGIATPACRPAAWCATATRRAEAGILRLSHRTTRFGAMHLIDF